MGFRQYRHELKKYIVRKIAPEVTSAGNERIMMLVNSCKCDLDSIGMAYVNADEGRLLQNLQA